MVNNICHPRTVNAMDHKATAMIHGKFKGEATVQVYAAVSLEAHGRFYPNLPNFILED